MTGANTKSNGTKTQMQGVPRELSEHLLDLPDLMRSIWKLHIQQWQNHLHNEVPNQNEVSARLNPSRNVTPQGPNLITFTPTPRQNEAAQGVTGRQSEPKKQRSPRWRKTRSEWQLNQRQFNENRSQEISHISPQEPVDAFNIEEPSMSYLQLPSKRVQQEETRLCSRSGETGHWKCYCQASTWCKFCSTGTHSTKACRRYANFVKDNQEDQYKLKRLT